MFQRTRKLILGAFLTLGFGCFDADPAAARYFKVYGYKTPSQGEMELVYWTNYVAKGSGDITYFGRTVDEDGLWRHTFEVEYGLTDRWTVAFYADFEQPSGEDLEYIQSRAVFLRYRLFERGERFFDPALYMEYYLPYQKYSEDEKLEARLILEKSAGPVNVRLNPIFDKILSGHDVEEGLEFEYGLGFYLEEVEGITPGVEFFGELGQIGDFKKLDDQEHLAFGTLKLELPMHLEFETGVGFGMTNHSDDVVVKGIFSYEYH